MLIGFMNLNKKIETPNFNVRSLFVFKTLQMGKQIDYYNYRVASLFKNNKL